MDDDDNNTIIGGAGGWWEADFCDGAASGRRTETMVWRCGMNLPPVLELDMVRFFVCQLPDAIPFRSEGEGVSINFGGRVTLTLDVWRQPFFGGRLTPKKVLDSILDLWRQHHQFLHQSSWRRRQ